MKTGGIRVSAQDRRLYQRVKEYRQEESDGGRLKGGDRVPSERVLAERFRSAG